MCSDNWYAPFNRRPSCSEEEASRMGSQVSATRSTVLVVEGEALMRLLVVQALTDAGFDVLETSDGDIAVRILERTASRVRAVVSDISLPSSMNGVLLARHTRTHWPW